MKFPRTEWAPGARPMAGRDWQVPLDPFREFQREVGRLFEAFEPWSGWRAFRPFPAINLYELGDRFLLMAELPGMEPEEISLSVSGETVVLQGERHRREKIADERFRRQERPFGRWMRTITLPRRVDRDRVTADLARGVLMVNLPKAEDAQPRQIPVMLSSL
jgi:HSP20 family protein